MARVTIELPSRFVFSTRVPIYTSHINQSRHLDSVALLTLLAEARARMLDAMDYRRDNSDMALIVADTAVAYRSEAFYGETLLFEIGAADFNKYGCDLVFRASVHGDGREVARGKNGMLFFDYRLKKPVPAPAEWVERLTTSALW
jgi:4-hydroxybenzoyl-CoA thioesterase